MSKQKINAEDVRKAFIYSADGKLFWQNPPKNHAEKRMSVAGNISPKGYWLIQFKGRKYRRSHLVFLYHYGRLPTPVCDHINHNRDDDRIENLRELTVFQNNQNTVKTSVMLRRSGRFQARIGQKHIGMFNTRKEAEDACKFEKTVRLGV